MGDKQNKTPRERKKDNKKSKEVYNNKHVRLSEKIKSGKKIFSIIN